MSQNVSNILAQNPNWHRSTLPSNLSYHNLCQYLTPPPCLEIILGLGEKYCIEKRQPSPPITATIHRLKRDIRVKQWLLAVPPKPATTEPSYIPSLYIRKESIMGPCATHIEAAMLSFAHDYTKAATLYRKLTK